MDKITSDLITSGCHQVGGFPVAVIDPPWHFATYSSKGALKHYPTMGISDIASLKVADVMSKDAVIFLWATWPNLTDAIKAGEAWGFTYVTCAFDWVKRAPISDKWHFGQGYYTRANSEPCLLFKRGKPLPRKSKGVSQIICDEYPNGLAGGQVALIEPVQRHSQKPRSTYKQIEKLFDGPYLSIFERQLVKGWTCLGNEITGNDIRDDLQFIIELQGVRDEQNR